MLTLKTTTVVWAVFAVLTLLTVIAAETGWTLGSYWTILSSLGVLSLLGAVTALWRTGSRLWPTLAVVIGLAIGQWWFVETMFALTMRNWHGFAP